LFQLSYIIIIYYDSIASSILLVLLRRFDIFDEAGVGDNAELGIFLLLLSLV
jgi:hypothetical protein